MSPDESSIKKQSFMASTSIILSMDITMAYYRWSMMIMIVWLSLESYYPWSYQSIVNHIMHHGCPVAHLYPFIKTFFEGHPARQMGCPDRLWNRQVRSLRQVGRDGNWCRPGLRRIQHGVVGVVLFTVVVCFPKGKLANSAMKHKRSIDRTIYPRIYPLYKLMKITQKTHKLQFLSLQKMIVAGFGSWVKILVPAE